MLSILVPVFNLGMSFGKIKFGKILEKLWKESEKSLQI